MVQLSTEHRKNGSISLKWGLNKVSESVDAAAKTVVCSYFVKYNSNFCSLRTAQSPSKSVWSSVQFIWSKQWDDNLCGVSHVCLVSFYKWRVHQTIFHMFIWPHQLLYVVSRLWNAPMHVSALSGHFPIYSLIRTCFVCCPDVSRNKILILEKKNSCEQPAPSRVSNSNGSQMLNAKCSSNSTRFITVIQELNAKIEIYLSSDQLIDW